MSVERTLNYGSAATAYANTHYDFGVAANMYAGHYNANSYGFIAIEFTVPDPGINYGRNLLTFRIPLYQSYTANIPSLLVSITRTRLGNPNAGDTAAKSYMGTGPTDGDPGRVWCTYASVQGMYNHAYNPYTLEVTINRDNGIRLDANTTYYLVLSAGAPQGGGASSGDARITKNTLSTYNYTITYLENRSVNYHGNARRADCTVSNLPASGWFLEGEPYTIPDTVPTHTDLVDYSAVYGQGNGGNDVNATIQTNTPVNFYYRWTPTSAWADPIFISTAGGTVVNFNNYDQTRNANPVNLYAHWELGAARITPAYLPVPSRNSEIVDNYLVTFNANGGSCNTSSVYAKKKINYDFSHWRRSSDGATFDRNYGFTEATTVTAQYTAYSNAGDYYGIELPTPTREGYNFKGWSHDASAKSGVFGSYLPSGHMTLYAIWAFKYTDYTMYLGTEELSGMYLGEEEVRVCIPENML